VLMMREVMTFYLISAVISILTGILYAISLVISKAGKNIWLKTEGILLIVLGLASSFMMIWSLNLLGLQNNANVEIATQWINLGASLAPIPLIILFYQEYQRSSAEQEVSGKLKYEDLLYAFTGLLVLAGLVVGAKMSTQTYWSRHISPEEQVLINKFESRTFEDNEGHTLEYLFMKPQDYDTTKKYPLVICLHGGPQSAKSERVHVTEPAPLLSDPVNREKYPAFLFVPQAPPALSWGGTPFYRSIDSLLMESIQALEEEYAIDEKRIYLTGISMGGYGTWYLMGTRPDVFAAGIPMCGAGDPSLASNMVDIPVWAFHGSEDKNVPVSGSRDMIAAIKEAGGDPKYTEFPDVAHHVWPHVSDTPGVFDWLFAQRKE
jgi:predicted peptidase